MRGYSLASQQIREAISKGIISVPETDLSKNERGWFNNPDLEARVQPSSFEPTIGDEVFVLDTEEQGAFRPEIGKTVYRSLIELPLRQRQLKRVEDTVFQTGFTYLLPVNEKISLPQGWKIRSSPKSSTGRLFPLTRMVADYNPTFDNFTLQKDAKDQLQLWLLFQPTAFNVVLRPGLTLNQLRFFRGKNVSLSQTELISEFKKSPLIYERGENGEMISQEPIITDDGLQINLDLTGKNTHGIAGLRARKNPLPIDMGKKGYYNAEEFFEPVTVREGKIRLKSGEHYLLASAGVLNLPIHLSAELRRLYGLGIRGVWDEAGFVDNSFTGDLVSEAVPGERNGLIIPATSDIPFSALEFFRTNITPDKSYGEGIGSHYYGQLGPRPSKHFKEFNFARAAKEYDKLSKIVLTQDARILLKHRNTDEGFEFMERDSKKVGALFRDIEVNPIFHSRYDCEGDPFVLQPIPHVLFFNSMEEILAQVRSDDIKEYGEVRLHGKLSIGFGGHIRKDEGPNYIRNCLRREIDEEVKIEGRYSDPVFVGTLFSREKEVDKDHLGLVYASHVNGKITANEKSMKREGLVHFAEIRDGCMGAEMETWTKLLVPYLSRIYKMTKPQ